MRRQIQSLEHPSDRFFRFLRTDLVDYKHWKRIRTSYQAHLKRIAVKVPLDARKFFFTDVFHDGWMSLQRVDPYLGEVDLRLSCPNVRIKPQPHQDWRYLNVDVEFICQFHGVIDLVIHRESGQFPIRGRRKRTAPEELQFMFSEVDVSAEFPGHFSLTMWFLPDAVVRILSRDLLVKPLDVRMYRNLIRRKNVFLPWGWQQRGLKKGGARTGQSKVRKGDKVRKGVSH